MREILFRGKNEDRGWIYGDLRNYEKSGAKAIFSHELLHRVEVAPKTIGQFTGLTDKNGKRIFEGDICKGAWGTMFQVVYDDCYLGFRAIVKSGLSVSIDYYGLDRIEVIGNIHDNPELLEETT
jgi:uncharacterized phage protein (TIGR01671 family)